MHGQRHVLDCHGCTYSHRLLFAPLPLLSDGNGAYRSLPQAPIYDCNGGRQSGERYPSKIISQK